MARRLALITGASAGIGAASARIYADHGYDVAITARRGDRLEALAQEISLRFGVEAIPIVADLADPAAPAAILEAVAAHGREVDALVNNAGYGLNGTFAATDWIDQRDSLQVMLTAPTELVHRVLPGMVERKFGRIVNVASLAGLVPGSVGQTLYAGIKSYLIKFSQSLHLENLNTGVHVTALCPGFTWSEFHDVNGAREMLNASTPAWLWLGADEVAASGYEAAEANRPVCVTGAPNKAIAAFAKLIPDDWALALMAGQGGRFRKV
ncbi:short-subunit dehydrogenase [Caulobacter ginsengisoli]|uniref:Short-subunit dehydrogenase n=1 Tax=Caulobacter ginsengisoli TaxID=400775 RepID=A0ABU0IVH2_9CAUL|nr:SDR family NAD(P)-dependent oxidoreductase [Caulobacter ginsengisoli]MDQ0465346.1 short-subunit dehydrogenase [Caulobacter ginsengisoli]